MKEVDDVVGLLGTSVEVPFETAFEEVQRLNYQLFRIGDCRRLKLERTVLSKYCTRKALSKC